MSAEEKIEEQAIKRGVNLNVKASPFALVMAVISLVVNIVLVVRFADSKTSREDVKEIVGGEIRIMNESQKNIQQSLTEIKTDIRFLKGEYK